MTPSARGGTGCCAGCQTAACTEHSRAHPPARWGPDRKGHGAGHGDAAHVGSVLRCCVSLPRFPCLYFPHLLPPLFPIPLFRIPIFPMSPFLRPQLLLPHLLHPPFPIPLFSLLDSSPYRRPREPGRHGQRIASERRLACPSLCPCSLQCARSRSWSRPALSPAAPRRTRPPPCCRAPGRPCEPPQPALALLLLLTSLLIVAMRCY